jgi:hypothetical protein
VIVRKLYGTPVVSDYGTVGRLTQGMGGSGVDSLGPGAPVATMSMLMNSAGSPVAPGMYPWDIC